jgi:Flp pilus assembly secretin CpaC
MSRPTSWGVAACAALLSLSFSRAMVGDAVAAESATQRRELTLSPGEQRIIPGEGVETLSTSTPGVADVRVTDDQKQIVVVAKAPGSTTLLLIFRNGTRVEYAITVSRIRARRNIRLDVYVVQIDRHRGLQLGLLWPASLGATVAAQAMVNQAGTYTAQVSAVSQVIPQLDFARNKGWAKVLDQARVVVTNGEEGNYSSGGEMYIRVAGGLAANLERIQFGTHVKARLAYDDATGRIEGHIDAEVSRVTSANVDGIPALAKVSLATAVNLELGQSIALAGLFSEDESDDLHGLPLLSEIPILGVFFGSRGLRQQHQENVIFIVPNLVGAVGLEQRDRVAEAFKLFRDYDGDTDQELGNLRQDQIVRTTRPRSEGGEEAPAPPRGSNRGRGEAP